MKLKPTRFLVTAIFSVASLAALVTPAMSQSAQTEMNKRTIVRYRIHPSRIPEFRAAVREMQELRKKAGSERYSTWWETESGPREFVSVRWLSKWAELDTVTDPKMRDMAGQMAALGGRMMGCVESMERIFDLVLPELSLPRSAETPAMVATVRTWVKRGMADAYMALVKSDLVPAAKKAGLKLYLVSRTQFGGARTEFRSARSISSYADLDSPAPIVTAMGPEAYQKFQAKLNPMIEGSEYQVLRLIPEMSHTAAR